jgi:hypothetical protein
MNSYKYHIHNLGGKVAYSDTDSLVCNIELEDYLVSGSKLGLMKLEPGEGRRLLELISWLLSYIYKSIIRMVNW